MGKDKILDRVMKLMRKSESAEAIGSVAEAEAFAVKAQELLFRERIEDEELLDFVAKHDNAAAALSDRITLVRYSPRDYGRPVKRKRTLWEQLLASVIAESNMCRIVVASGSNYITFIGFRQDAELSRDIYARLVEVFAKDALRQYDREYNKLYNKGLDTWSMRGWRSSFLNAAVVGLNEKLRAQRIEMEQEQKGTALIRLTEDAVIQYMKTKYKGFAAGLGGSSDYNTAGAAAGHVYGRTTNTLPQIK